MVRAKALGSRGATGGPAGGAGEEGGGQEGSEGGGRVGAGLRGRAFPQPPAPFSLAQHVGPGVCT